MKTAVIGRCAMTRATLLSVFVTTLLALGCAPPPKPRELDALEKLRSDPQMPAARKKAPDLCKKADKALSTATDKWQSNDLNDSVNSALLSAPKGDPAHVLRR